MKRGILAAMAFAATLAAQSAQAVVITEAADFAGSLFSNNLAASLAAPTALGPLDPGANSISGSVDATCFFGDNFSGIGCIVWTGDLVDAVSFVVPDGEELTAATLTIENLVDDSFFTGVVRTSSSTGLAALESVGAGVYDILGGLARTGLQNYGVEGVLGVGSSAGDTISFDWRLDLTVSNTQVVPLPASLPLLLGGLGALALLRRRRA